MVPLQVGMEKTDRYRGNSIFPEKAGNPSHLIPVGSRQHLPLRRDSFRYSTTPMAGDQRFRFLQAEVIEFVANLIPHLQDVPEPSVGNQTGPGAFSFD